MSLRVGTGGGTFEILGTSGPAAVTGTFEHFFPFPGLQALLHQEGKATKTNKTTHKNTCYFCFMILSIC